MSRCIPNCRGFRMGICIGWYRASERRSGRVVSKVLQCMDRGKGGTATGEPEPHRTYHTEQGRTVVVLGVKLQNTCLLCDGQMVKL